MILVGVILGFACPMFHLCVASQMHSDQLVAGLALLTTDFLSRFRTMVVNATGCHHDVLTFVPLCDLKRIWYIADGSLVSLAKFSWVAV